MFYDDDLDAFLDDFAVDAVYLKNSAATVVEDCEDAWNEVSATGCTVTATATNKQVGTNCVKIAMTTSTGIGIVAAEALSAVNMSAMTHVSFFILCTVATSAGDLQLCLDNTARCASPVKTLNIPALNANEMTLVVLELGTAAAGQSAIISIGLKMTKDLGACDVYIDQVRAYDVDAIKAIYDAPGSILTMGSASVITSEPQVTVKSSDVSGISNKDFFYLSGQAYFVAAYKHDGTGLSIVTLAERKR